MRECFKNKNQQKNDSNEQFVKKDFVKIPYNN